DSIIFFTGRKLGQSFPDSWFIRAINNKKVHRQFAKHGNKAVFFARFLAGVRIGVYGYAGQHGMRWPKFIFLDLLGALISGPTSIFFGRWAARTLAPGEPPKAAIEQALALFEDYKPMVMLVTAGVIASVILYAVFKTRRYRTEIKPAIEEKTADPKSVQAEGVDTAEKTAEGEEER
ncbi:MAG: VTT domain-containing protein, partial [Planctomycetes bacterium]|nr:VTT domain-containing protein [Planctomycetota bacterium]